MFHSTKNRSIANLRDKRILPGVHLSPNQDVMSTPWGISSIPSQYTPPSEVSATFVKTKNDNNKIQNINLLSKISKPDTFWGNYSTTVSKKSTLKPVVNFTQLSDLTNAFIYAKCKT